MSRFCYFFLVASGVWIDMRREANTQSIFFVFIHMKYTRCDVVFLLFQMQLNILNEISLRRKKKQKLSQS